MLLISTLEIHTILRAFCHLWGGLRRRGLWILFSLYLYHTHFLSLSISLHSPLSPSILYPSPLGIPLFTKPKADKQGVQEGTRHFFVFVSLFLARTVAVLVMAGPHTSVCRSMMSCPTRGMVAPAFSHSTACISRGEGCRGSRSLRTQAGGECCCDRGTPSHGLSQGICCLSCRGR